MSKQIVNPLRLALRALKEKKTETKSEKQAVPSELETAMAEFEAATTPAEKAKAFKAALDLSRDSD